jgi:hypothetical protein
LGLNLRGGRGVDVDTRTVYSADTSIAVASSSDGDVTTAQSNPSASLTNRMPRSAFSVSGIERAGSFDRGLRFLPGDSLP